MSFKHLFPTFRARWLFLERALGELGRVSRILHVGCGEGDHDRAIKRSCEVLVACDVNEADVEHARAAHRDVAGIEYRVEDATALRLEDASFDAVVCMEVLEHVGEPRKLLSEIARVLAPGGRCVLTVPSEHFPATYDPINWLLARTGTHVPIGAYAYGHEWLVRAETLRGWLEQAGFAVAREERLTGWLAAPAELYWVGLAQRVAKANARNTRAPASVSVFSAHAVRGRGLVRPSPSREPLGVGLVDALVRLDAAVSRRSPSSVGLGYVLVRRDVRVRRAPRTAFRAASGAPDRRRPGG